MADITDPQAIKFSNEQIRPMSEYLVQIQAECEYIKGVWDGGMNALFPNDSSPLQDGRENEGVSRLTGEDINSFMNQVNLLLTQFGQPGVMDVLRKPNVRPLKTLGA